MVSDSQMLNVPHAELQWAPKPAPQLDFDPKLQSSEIRTSASTATRTLGIWISWSSPRRNSRSNAALVGRQ